MCKYYFYTPENDTRFWKENMYLSCFKVAEVSLVFNYKSDQNFTTPVAEQVATTNFVELS